jgi:hypothetical protein
MTKPFEIPKSIVWDAFRSGMRSGLGCIPVWDAFRSGMHSGE